MLSIVCFMTSHTLIGTPMPHIDYTLPHYDSSLTAANSLLLLIFSLLMLTTESIILDASWVARMSSGTICLLSLCISDLKHADGWRTMSYHSCSICMVVQLITCLPLYLLSTTSVNDVYTNVQEWSY